MMPDVRVVDHGAKALVRRLERLDRLRVTVGVQGREARRRRRDSRTVTVGQVAHVVQFGTENFPARPFMDMAVPGVRRVTPSIAADVAGNIVRAANPRPEDQLRPLGAAAAVPVFNAADEVVGEGETRDSVTWAVRRGQRIVRRGKS